jgi:hypothetical protein
LKRPSGADVAAASCNHYFRKSVVERAVGMRSQVVSDDLTFDRPLVPKAIRNTYGFCSDLADAHWSVDAIGIKIDGDGLVSCTELTITYSDRR